MFKLSTGFLAVTLAVSSIGASAQSMTNRDDMFGQDAPATETSFSAPAAPQKVRITNTDRSDRLQSDTAALQQGHGIQRNQMGAQRNQTGLQRNQNGVQRQGVNGDSAYPREPEVISEFQKFLSDSTGEILPIFGAGFFESAQSAFTPIGSGPLPADQPLGPGDELLIRGTGTIDIDYRATIDRSGTISIPTVGTVVLAGVKAGSAEGVIRAAIARLYKGVNVNVTFGQLRSTTVYVVGQAKRPGTYTVSSLSTLVTALFASGGPNANGSMRQVQVKRAGKVVAELDLYAFIAKGDKSGDIRLQDGDTIVIPPAGGFVALVGKVNEPAIYEIKGSGDTVESLLDLSGGLPVVADPRRAFLERIDPSRSQPRSVEQFPLDGAGLKRSLKDGDVLNITSITPDFSNAVVLRGNVDQAVRVPFKSNMRVSDLIPSREYLITRSSIKRQNNAVTTSEEVRELRKDKRLTDRDRQELGIGRSEVLGEGEHTADGEERSIASRIGGLIDEINWDYAVVERINRIDLSVKLIPFNLGNVFTNPHGPDNIQLQPGDTVTVFSHEDVAVPMDKRRVFVRVEGEVQVPGVYQMSAGETLQSLLARAGGPTGNAYLFGTAFYREQVRKEQQINLEKAAVRLEAQLRSQQAKGIANVSALSAADAAAAASQRQVELQIAEETIRRFRQLKPTGRIAFGLEPHEKSFAVLPRIKLANGDRLVVPARPDFVHVFGAVNAEASPLWRANSRVKDYLRVAGVTADADVDNVFVIRVDGTVVTKGASGWLSMGMDGIEVMPGDSIVIPEKFDKETAWTKFTRGTREWAQIFANFGLGAAAIKTLR
ncbi:polysaccharide biosynthesis/export family protein [Massilia sp. GCM10023247]|uniref:polysaccharide biosynthesis/export family protein n=1 Tax=Massilia sp. GCM10023247 TaxID=3252643 RepID=UPI0036177904